MSTDGIVTIVPSPTDNRIAKLEAENKALDDIVQQQRALIRDYARELAIHQDALRIASADLERYQRIRTITEGTPQ